jgi:signal transduction histidine kinase
MTEQSAAGTAPAAGHAPASAGAAEAQDSPREGEQRSAARRGSRLALRNWRVSWRLIALIAIPTVTAMAFGLVRIDEAMKSAAADQRVEQLADLGNATTHLAYAMEDERDGLAGYIAASRPKGAHTPTGAPTASLNADYARTNAAASQVTSLASGITSNSAFSAQVQADLAAVLDRISDLPHFRSAATASRAPSLTVITSYSDAIADLFTLNDQIDQGSSDPTLSDTVRALGAMARTEDQASQQRGLLYAALVSKQFEPGAASTLTSAQAQQDAEFAEFQSAATIDQQQFYSDTVAGPQVDNAQAMELQAIASGGNGGTLVVSPPQGSPAGKSVASIWNTDMTQTLTDMRVVEQNLVNSVIGQSRSQHAALTRTAVETGIEVLAVLIVVLMITIVVARSMVRPLRKLRTGALEVAGIRLPDTVRRMSETDGEGVSLEVEPIDVDSSDEIGEVARAFDQVHREALRLAANEAALRGNVNAMFVNLSRRSQSLVERQIRLIDDLEQGEQDPERLASLFQMDHLATRMRRNSENLLVLAGHDESRRWNQPVALVDVLRAALSEIEQYERVTLNVQPGIAVRGQAVSDVVHLTAELVENATSFSAADTPVTIAGHLLSSGGVLLEITDQGVGMGAEEMAHANWRLDNPPVVDVAVSRRMGLFVVARLAARHVIRVRLRPADTGGVVTLVWLPDETITRESPRTPGMPRRRQPEHEDSLPGPGSAWAATGPLPSFRDIPPPAVKPGAGVARAPGGQFVSGSREAPRSPSGVIVPPAEDLVEQSRLPIFEAVESDWFRQVRRVLERHGQASEAGGGWSSPADEGWRAAEVAHTPSSDGVTPAGLPKRVPQANLVPGAVPAPPAGDSAAAAASVRSAATSRDRFVSYQRGVRRGRAAATGTGPEPGGGAGEESR